MILLVYVTLLTCFLVGATETGNQLGKIITLSTFQVLFLPDRFLKETPCCHMAS